ncbi:MAG: c-type cytochrome [Deltaproteobacteria bacterium]|nr:c-type cytochrome [Deltaproteobacteria bacterium]
MKNGTKLGAFWSTIITLIVVYGIIEWIIPLISRKITGLPFPLSVPGTLIIFYIALTLVALGIYISFSEEKFQEFLNPIKKLLSGEYGANTRTVALVIAPLIFGWQVYSSTVPKVSSPISLRIQHPSSNFPKAMETLENPLRNPNEGEVEKFIQEVKANKVEFIPEAMPDVEKVKGKYENILGFIPTEPMQAFLKEVKAGNINKDKAKHALIEKYLFEGRALYAMNCRPCHGDSTAGDGPMADGFRLRPINFTDNGTIETIVEGYTFWRVANGGRGLPAEATPWDSAMPVWKGDLPEEYRWKILLAEYDMAQKTPRQPEKAEGKKE